MDINDLRSLITVAAFTMFCAIVIWAWSGGRRAEFEAAARMPLDEELPETDTLKGPRA